MGNERNLLMKKTAYRFNTKAAALIMSSAMLISLTACTQPVYRLDPATTTTMQTNSSTAVSESNKDQDSGNENVYAYSALLAALENEEVSISKYTNMTMGHPDSDWLYPSENIPCALADVTGDGLEELIILVEGPSLSANLKVYMYDAAKQDTTVILTVEGLNMQANSGRGVVIGVSGEGKLIVIDSPRSHDEYTSCSVYSFNGTELIPELTAMDVVSYTDEPSSNYHTYKVNDNDVGEAEYTKTRDQIVSSISALYQYAFVCGDEFKTKVSSMTSSAMSYDAMHEYLRGKVN